MMMHFYVLLNLLQCKPYHLILCSLISLLTEDQNSEAMGDAIDLTGDEGVIKTIVRRAKPDAIAPSENLPLVDGVFDF